MADQREIDGEKLFRDWEDQCIDGYNESKSNYEELGQFEKEQNSQKLWASFQNSASAVAQLYKDRHQGLSLWIPFQNAAGSVTILYKDGLEQSKRAMELGIQLGHQRRTKELLQWAKKRRRHIRREDLIAYLCGKNPPIRSRTSTSCSKSPSWPNVERSSPMRSTPQATETNQEADLKTFRDALALQGLNGAMSNVTAGFASGTSVKSNVDDLNCFIMNEFSRHNERKRPASPSDVIMDSPTRKKSRYDYF